MMQDERIAKIRGGHWIRYARAEQIDKKLDELLRLPKTRRMPNLLIAGETNNGKTALVTRFVRRHPPELGAHGTPSGVPVIAIQAPPIPDERRFYQAILTRLFAPFRPSRSAGLLQYEVMQLLATVGLRMLIIDEVQHVLAGPLLKQRHFLNVIKYLGNELQIPIVAVGTHDAFNAIHTDPQLANRFEPALLAKWTMNDEYLRLLASFEIALGLKHRSNLLEPDLAMMILSLGEGTIGEIAALLSRAALHAIERGTERITTSALQQCGYTSPSKRRSAAVRFA